MNPISLAFLICFVLFVIVISFLLFKTATEEAYKAGYQDGYSAYQIEHYIPSGTPVKRKDIRLKEKE